MKIILWFECVSAQLCFLHFSPAPESQNVTVKKYKKLARFFLRLSRKRRMPAPPNASDPLPVRAINAGFPPRVPLPRDIRKGKLYATRSESPCRPIRVTTYGRPRND